MYSATRAPAHMASAAIMPWSLFPATCCILHQLCLLRDIMCVLYGNQQCHYSDWQRA
jgi:hypothetical protein